MIYEREIQALTIEKTEQNYHVIHFASIFGGHLCPICVAIVEQWVK